MIQIADAPWIREAETWGYPVDDYGYEPEEIFAVYEDEEEMFDD